MIPMKKREGYNMNDHIKVFVADIDGTLAGKGERLMPHTREALEKMHQDGIKIGVATGRPLDSRVLEKPKFWNLSFDFDFAIGMNGGDLWQQGDEEINHYYLLDKKKVRLILELLQGFDLNAIIYEKGYDRILCLRMDEFMKDSMERNNSHVIVGDIDRLSQCDTGKIEVHCLASEKERILEKLAPYDDGSWVMTQTFAVGDNVTIEFLDPRVNKGMGLEKYMEHNGYAPDEVIGFGDMENDIPLLEKAGWGVCLANGSAQTKQIADAVTDYTVEEDGLGRYLEDHIFNA
ncbi:HAD-IIB family hydrolase [uncultured Dubosiella sp.]|uniref:HAD-IIB family hydrolase n=3 Tax=uncultured Dubosiella sp. TaxID=1937011 RepID=UPI0025F8A785|nr:HAD-IIB family hydrolase [uncultured Dubosiella sp.]